MVEGPGCKLKGIKIKAKLTGQAVKEVRGNAVNKCTKKGGQASPFHQLTGRTLDGVETLGKELFMYFGDICLRIHFLMSGQSFINNQSVDKDPGGKAETATLELQMTSDLLTFRNSAADIRLASDCHQKFVELNDLDICSPVFNFGRAVSLMLNQPDRLVCDVLLDQSILPGVGNIIKNEALFDSGIRPSSKVSDLQEEHVKHLVKMTRDFTNIFYMCRRDGKPLYPYYKIYGKRQCKQCEGRVTICRLGEDNDRMTYYCESCQTNSIEQNPRKLPVKNSLLGWVKSEASAEPAVQWACTMCTLVNASSQYNCSACFNPRTSNKQSVTQSASQQCNNSGKSSITSLHRTSLQTQNLSSAHVFSNKKRAFSEIDNVQAKAIKLDKQANVKSGQSMTGSVHQPNSLVESSKCTEEQKESSHKIPPCPSHKRKCSMKEVRKPGDNSGRWFFSCPVRSCKFFEWADVKFPICSDHGKPCTLRTVLKIGPNNGRKFFTCKLPRNKQCKFFEWAIGYD